MPEIYTLFFQICVHITHGRPFIIFLTTPLGDDRIFKTMNKSIFVIDDNDKLCQSLEMNLCRLGYNYNYSTSASSAIEFLSNETPDLILLDLSLGKENGLEILEKIRLLMSTVPVIMITGFGTIHTAVEAIKAGAVDYIQKPLNFSHLLKIIESYLNNENPKTESYITQSPTMKRLMDKAVKLAKTDFPVLITGESGTGKEKLAHFIHEMSSRKEKKLQIINSAAFLESLLDNELFGHERGAYTGADKQFKGIFERADGSSLFMDEIGDMTLQTQVKILRTLQNNEIRRIGGNENLNIDVRFIGATNKDLNELMANGRFREDLYYRLSTAVLHIPTLKERIEDILPLAHFFIKENFPDRDFSLTAEAERVLLNYHWPGNIRELKNCIHYSGALASGKKIDKSDLPNNIYGDKDSHRNGVITLEDQERELIIKALTSANQNKKKAAEFLSISRKTLYNKMAKYGINNE